MPSEAFCRWLSHRVIARAVLDFCRGDELAFDLSVLSRTQMREGRLRVAERVDAGRFLLERTDTCSQFWFQMAGLNLEQFRGRQQMRAWRDLLAKLTALETDLVGRLARRAA